MMMIESLVHNNDHLMSYFRLPNIKHLNGSEVTSPEREKSERHLIRFFNDKAEKPERFHDLEKKHGRFDQITDNETGNRS